MSATPITRIVVAGGGLVGWCAAAMLKHRSPNAEVIVAGAVPDDALTERIGSTLPSAVGFHEDIGLDEGQVAQATGMAFRLGTAFEGWNDGLPGYVHGYSEYGRQIGIGPFHQYWVRQAQSGAAVPFDSLSAAAVLGRADRFVHPPEDEASPLAGIEYGLTLDPRRYRELMRAYALHLGAVERSAAIAEVRIAAGRVEALLLADGSEVAGQMFVDCTGPQALVRSRLDDRFEDWGRWLPCDRVLFADAPGTADPPSLDRVTAHPAGWRWQSACRARTSHGLVYASAQLSDGRAERVLRGGAGADPGAPLAIRQGRVSRPWLGNCVAIGDAAVGLEPLEWANLHLVHSALDRITAKLPDSDFSDVELWDYNREAAAEADRVRDFLVLHYVTANRPKDEFWRAAAAAEPPESLAHTLELFRERGRLPYYEESTFTKHSWAAVLLGQGVLPRRFDPLIDTVPPEQSAAAMAQFRQQLATLAATLPRQGDYIRHLAGQGPR